VGLFGRALQKEEKATLVYNTARSIEAYTRLAKSAGLPQPDILITGEGTEIRYDIGTVTWTLPQKSNSSTNLDGHRARRAFPSIPNGKR